MEHMQLVPGSWKWMIFMCFWQNVWVQLVLWSNDFWVVEICVIPTMDDHLLT